MTQKAIFLANRNVICDQPGSNPGFGGYVDRAHPTAPHRSGNGQGQGEYSRLKWEKVFLENAVFFKVLGFFKAPRVAIQPASKFAKVFFLKKVRGYN